LNNILLFDTPLHLAIVFGKTEATIILLDRGANIEVKNSKGNSPLNLAAWRGDTKLVNLLLHKKANIETKIIVLTYFLL